MKATEKVMDALQKAEGPLKAGEIAEKTGLDKKEVDQAMKLLKDTESIVSPKRCYWQPK